MKDGDGTVSDDQDRFEYIELADGPDDLPKYEDVRDRPRRPPPVMPDAVVINGVLTRRGMPEWADFERWWQQEHGPRPDPEHIQERALLDAEDAYLDSYQQHIALVDPDDLDTRRRSKEMRDRFLNGQVDPRFEHIATWWDRYTERPRTRTPTFLQAKVAKRKPGPTPGTVKTAKYKSADAWQTAIREKVLTKATRLSADDETIAFWLEISSATMYRLMRRPHWKPRTLEELRNGKF
jgi:hypothetical protein